MEKNKDTEIISVDFECSACQRPGGQSTKIPVLRVIEKLETFFAKNDLCGAERLLEYWQSEAEALADLSGELSVVNEMLGLFRRTNNKEKAKKAVDRALELLHLTQTEELFSGATVMLNAATTCKAFGDVNKALLIYEKVLKIYEKELAEDDVKRAGLYNNYATALVDINDFEKAEKFYKRAIELTSKQVSSLPDCAISYVNLAHLWEKKEGGESLKIEECMKKAEELLTNEEIKTDAYFAFVLSKCAPSFDYFGYFLFAKKISELSREIYERA